MARLCADQDIRMVSGMASWALVLFEKALERAKKKIPLTDTTVLINGGLAP